LEELDRVARWVVEQDLLTAWTFDNVVAERQPGGPKTGDLGCDVGDNEVDAIPTARSWHATIGHVAPGRASRTDRSNRRLPRCTSAKAGTNAVLSENPRRPV
jgi:hypothetical protein